MCDVVLVSKVPFAVTLCCVCVLRHISCITEEIIGGKVETNRTRYSSTLENYVHTCTEHLRKDVSFQT